MTTIYLIKDDGKLGDQAKPMELKPDTLVSYFEYFKGVSGNKGTLIRDWHKSASGTAKHDGFVKDSGVSYEVRITGQWKDVQVVVKRLQDALGAKDITPVPQFFELPDLSDIMARIRWMLKWFRTGNK